MGNSEFTAQAIQKAQGATKILLDIRNTEFISEGIPTIIPCCHVCTSRIRIILV